MVLMVTRNDSHTFYTQKFTPETIAKISLPLMTADFLFYLAVLHTS